MRIRSLVTLLLAWLGIASLSACQPTVYLMPTPEAFRSGQIDPFAGNPDPKGSPEVRVEYATTRLPIGPRTHRWYGTAHDDTLRLGEAIVEIGENPIPWAQLHRESTTGERRKAHVLRLKQAVEEAEIPDDVPLDRLPPEARAYFRRLNKRIDRSPHRELTLYVHGANNNFYRTTAQAAQFRHFTGRNSVVMVFAWPSVANLLRYGSDVENARAAAPVFARLLELLARHSHARHINVIAYSAGAMVVSPGLAYLRRKHGELDSRALRRRLRIGEVYFAAPDVDFRGFLRDLRSYEDMACRVTLTVNLNDSVLGLAEYWHGQSRAGRPNVEDLSMEESRQIIEATRNGHFDVLDIGGSGIPNLSPGAHNFWYNNPWVSSDVLTKLVYHAPPAARGLARLETPEGAVIWYFPPDYPRRVVAAVTRLEAEWRGDPCDLPAPPGNGGNAPRAGTRSPARSPRP